MADVNLPAIGRVPKGWLYGVGLGSAGLIAFLYYRHKSTANTAAAAAAAASPATDTTTADSGIDPATGVPYSQEYGSGYGAGGAGSPYGPSFGGYYDPNSGALVYPGTGTTTPPITTNAAWAQAVEQFANSVGVDPTAMSAAIGKYLTGQAVTANQADLVDQAIAWEGYPPVTGPNNYPPSIRTQPTTKPPPQGGGKGGHSLARVSGLHAIDAAGPRSIDLAWSPVAGAVKYSIFYSTSDRAGSWHRTTRVSGTSGRLNVPRRGTHYFATVAAVGVDGIDGPYANPVSFTTRKK